MVLGEELYKAVRSGDNKATLSLLTDLKTHVKKDNVNLSYVPKYFEALSTVLGASDSPTQTVAFSCVCHLVKRVSIQDNSGKLLADHSFLLLPIIIPKMADVRSSASGPARRALEAYWLCAPAKVELALVEIGLRNRNVLIANECVVWLNRVLVEVNNQFKLDAFLDALAGLLARNPSNNQIVQNVSTLFANYHDLSHNSILKHELQKQLEANGVPSNVRASVMGTNSSTSGKHEESKSRADWKPKPVREVLEREKRGPLESKERETKETSDSRNGVEESSSEISQLTEKLPSYRLDPNIAPKNIDSYESIHRLVSEMLPYFEGKETERNWGKREKSIQLLRCLLRGNARDDYLADLLLAIKAVSEGIQKAFLSLRTTLCVHSCQLIKEMAILLGPDFDSLAEQFLASLIKLSSATKHLANTNANIAISAILINCTLQSRVIQKISLAATDKSASTKAYAAFWLEIYMVRTNSQPGSSDLVERLLPKLLGDPNMQVRLAAKDSYWRFCKYSPELGENLLSKLDTNVVRALERSRPASDRFTAPLLPRKSRPSIKEAIAAKNRQLRAKPEIRSNSSFLPRRPSELELERSRSQTSRVASDPLKSTPAPHFDSEPHYAQSTFSHRTTSRLAHESPKASSAPPVERSSLDSGTSHAKLVRNASRSPKDGHNFVARKPHSAQSPTGSRLTLGASFNGQNDPIIKFLSSSQEEFIREGVNLLRFAVIGGEGISSEIKLAIRKVSITSPDLLRPLFEENDNLFRKASPLFHVDDMFRVCAVILPANDKTVSNLLALYDIENVYESSITLLSYVADLDNIVDERSLVMQIIKFKSRILDFVVQSLTIVTSKMPISESKFAQLIANLFDLVPIVHSTLGYQNFQVLLQNLYAINKVAFTGQLSLSPSSTKSEVEQTVGIDRSLLYVPDGTIFNMTDLTQIAPGKSVVNLSPLKGPSDFTMLMPKTVSMQGNVNLNEANVHLDEPQMSFSHISTDEGLKTSESFETNDMDINEDGFEHSPEDEDVAMDDAEIIESAANLLHDRSLEKAEEQILPFKQAQSHVLPFKQVEPRVLPFKQVDNHVLPFKQAEHYVLPFKPIEQYKLPFKKLTEENNDQDIDQDDSEKEFQEASERDILDESDLEKFEREPIPHHEIEPTKLRRSNSFDKHDRMNIFASTDGVVKNTPFFTKLNSPDSSHELADDFAQVKLTAKSNSIQLFIDKVDPLNLISKKNRPIAIFEDSKAGSPQKLREYSYTDFNWFNFLVARLSLDRELDEEDNHGIEEFKVLCKNLGSCAITNTEFAALLEYLQNEQSAEFNQFYDKDGHQLIEQALWMFFLSSKAFDKLSGLIIAKQLLINRDSISLMHLWHTLLDLCSESTNSTYELEVAISETFDEALCGVYSSAELFHVVSKSLKESSSMETKTLRFCVESLFKLMSARTLALIINDELIRKTDEVLHDLLDHSDTLVRKHVLQSYGKLVRAARVSDVSGVNRSAITEKAEARCIDELLVLVTGPQKKLIEFFSQ